MHLLHYFISILYVALSDATASCLKLVTVSVSSEISTEHVQCTPLSISMRDCAGKETIKLLCKTFKCVN